MTTKRMTQFMGDDVGVVPVEDRDLLTSTNHAHVGPVAAVFADLDPVRLVRRLDEQGRAVRLDDVHGGTDTVLVR